MELRTQAVDRLLEALAPSLAAEMERVIEEFRQQMEQEFQSRLQSALHEAELATLAIAEVRQEEAVAEARETLRAQLTKDFEEQLNLSVQQVRDGMQAKSDEDMQAAFANWAADRAVLQEQLSRWRNFAEAQRQLAECTSQPEILARVLKLSEPFAESLAIYVIKPDGLSLWKSRGVAFPNLVSMDTIDPELYCKPAVVRDKMVAAVCAVQPCKVESLDFLMSCFERAIESFGLKLHTAGPKSPSPDSQDAPEPAPVPVVAESAPAVAPDPVPEPAPEVEEKFHAEARLPSRLLVSEIKLYNEQEVQEGRIHKDLYSRLRRQIEDGREEYRSRVHPGVIALRDYYHEELVRVLAEGEMPVLGEDYPGPLTS